MVQDANKREQPSNLELAPANHSQIWKWYVYELVDPRTNSVFYVGKGKGERVHQHEREAAKGICSEKTNRINEILSFGLEIGKRKIAYFWSEQDAYDYEAEVIAQYGLDNLTNAIPGGGSPAKRVKVIKEYRVETLSDWFDRNEGKCEEVFACFADWFRSGGHLTNKKIKIEVVDKSMSVHYKLTEAICNAMPTLWKSVQICDQSLKRFADRMKPYGIEVIYGCA